MSDLLQKLTEPSNASVGISWGGAFIAAVTANDLLVVLTIIYTALKIVGWFIDRRNKRKDTNEN